MLITMTVDYAITKVQEIQGVLKPDGAHQLLICANLLRETMNTMNKNTDILLASGKE